MAAYQTALLWSFMFLVADAEVPNIIHPFTSTCAVKGSTITLPCTFTPRKSGRNKDGQEVQLQVVRVRWCQNHEICHGTTPSVYDSDSKTHNPHYQYLGDLKGNCTLQIRDVQMKDNAVFRFRMEANDPAGHFTNQTGVTVTVVDGTLLRVRSSSKEFRRGETVSLQCTSGTCSFHQLEVTWSRDNHALTESGHTLKLGPLTAKDSGNYTCALKTNMKTRSEAFSLQVEDDPEEGGRGGGLYLILGGVFGAVLVVLVLILVVSFIKRRRAAAEQQKEVRPEGEQSDNVYSNILLPAEDDGAKETIREAEDVSYASVQFKQQNHNRHVVTAGDVIYSSLATRG